MFNVGSMLGPSTCIYSINSLKKKIFKKRGEGESYDEVTDMIRGEEVGVSDMEEAEEFNDDGGSSYGFFCYASPLSHLFLSFGFKFVLKLRSEKLSNPLHLVGWV